MTGVEQWDRKQVDKWLREVGLHEYIPIFSKRAITGVDLKELTQEDLQEMKIFNKYQQRHFERLKAGIVLSGIQQSWRDVPVSEWGRKQVDEWLVDSGLREHLANLRSNSLIGFDLLKLTGQELAELKILNEHHQQHFRRLQEGIVLSSVQSWRNVRVYEWGRKQVDEWLVDIGLRDHLAIIQSNALVGIDLLELTDLELFEMKITDKFHLSKFHHLQKDTDGGPPRKLRLSVYHNDGDAFEIECMDSDSPYSLQLAVSRILASKSGKGYAECSVSVDGKHLDMNAESLRVLGLTRNCKIYALVRYYGG